MARRRAQTGISPAGKSVILLVVFGIPLLFFGASWGLDKLFDVAPAAGILIILFLVTVFTARVSGLLYRYYEARTPILRFFPFIGEVTLIDSKYHLPCYILYALSLLAIIGAIAPYNITSKFGMAVAENHTFVCGMILAALVLIIQIIKGIGIIQCMNDVASDWYEQTHSDVGLIKRFSLLGFIPFVRVIAVYSLYKPLDTMVTFMKTTVSSAGEEDSFIEEDDDDDEEYGDEDEDDDEEYYEEDDDDEDDEDDEEYEEDD